MFLLSLAMMLAAPQWRPMPAPDRVTIAKAVGDKLLDGESARYRWPLEDPDAVLYCGFVNAKNLHGAYTGFMPFMVEGAHANGPKGNGRFKVYGVFIASADTSSSDTIIVHKFCTEHGFDLTKLPPE